MTVRAPSFQDLKKTGLGFNISNKIFLTSAYAGKYTF